MQNNICLIISETIQEMPIKFAVKIVRLKVDNIMIIASPMTLTFIQGRKCVWSLTGFELAISQKRFELLYIHTWHDGTLMDALYAHARFDDPDLDAMSQWVGKVKQISGASSRQLSKQYALNLLQR